MQNTINFSVFHFQFRIGARVNGYRRRFLSEGKEGQASRENSLKKNPASAGSSFQVDDGTLFDAPAKSGACSEQASREKLHKKENPASAGFSFRVDDGTRTHDPQNHNLMF